MARGGFMHGRGGFGMHGGGRMGRGEGVMAPAYVLITVSAVSDADAFKKAIEVADVCILATPPGFRPMMFEEAVRQGKNAFIEKPVAVDAPGVRRILAAAEEAK